jgi:NADH dehydrogenase
VDIHYGSVLDADALAGAFYGVGAVVSLVGIIRRGKGKTYDAINRRGVANLVAAAKEVRTKHFVQISAIGASSDRAYPYLYSKWQGEQEVVNSGLPYTILRPSIMFGEGDEFLTTLAGLVRVFPLAPVVGSGRNLLQPIAADDVAQCTAMAVDWEDLKGKTIEVGGPQQLSYNEIIAVVSRTLGKRRLRLHLPISLMYPATALLQALRPRPPATTDQLRMLAVRNVSEVGIVEKTFGFTPRTLEGNIDFVRSVTFADGLKIALGSMPAHLRDH